MKRLEFLIVTLFFSILQSKGQVNTQHFSLTCKCNLVNSDWDTKKNVHYYEIEFAEEKSILSISVKEDVTGDENAHKAFLNAISNNGTIPFQQLTFKSYFAIVGEVFINGYYTRHINFFTSDKMFSIIIGAESKTGLKLLGNILPKQFTPK